MTTTITVNGMSCQHCVNSVTKALEALDGVSNVQVDLLGRKATFDAGDGVDMADVKAAIDKIGFEAVI